MSYLLALLRRHPESVCPCRAVYKWVTPPPPTPSVCVAVHRGATCWPEADCLPACLPQSSIHPPTTNTLGGTYRNNRCDLFALFPDIDHEEALLTAATLSLDSYQPVTVSFNQLKCTLEGARRIKQGAGWCDPVVRAINLTFH